MDIKPEKITIKDLVDGYSDGGESGVRAYGGRLDVRPPSMLEPDEAERRNIFVKIVQSVRFPLHDHCKKVLRWSNAQVLMRFMLLQAFLMSFIFVVLVKIR